MKNKKGNRINRKVNVSVNQISHVDLITTKGTSCKDTTLTSKKISQDTLNPLSTNNGRKTTKRADSCHFSSVSLKIKASICLLSNKIKTLSLNLMIMTVLGLPILLINMKLLNRF